MKASTAFVSLALILAATTARAQQVPAFKLTNVVNNQTISLDTYPSCAGVVLIFTSNGCAYDEYYRGRIAKLASAFGDRVPLMLVNSSADPADTPDKMAAKAQAWNLTVPYLADKDQTLMQALGATKTPQVYLLKNNGGKFTVVYAGAIDDNAQVEADVRHAYLKDAIDIMLTNQRIETPEVRPVGCSIRKK